MSSPPEIRVITPIRHPRLRYVLDLIGNDLGYRFLFYNDRSVFGPVEARYAVHYGGTGPRSLPRHPLLSGRDPAPADLAPETGPDGLPLFFPTPGGHDLLACIFWTVSRYEEYADFTPDRHGRFSASAAHAHRHGYLQRPVVREWTAALERRLRAWFPDLPPPRARPLAVRPTYDIDLLWAWQHRGWRGRAGLLKDTFQGRFSRAVARLRSGPQTDPYYTIGRLEEFHRQHGLLGTYFWLLAGGTSRVDPNPYPIPDAQRQLMRRLEAHARIGLHPSYRSPDRPELVTEERERIEEILDHGVCCSRQHFLRFRLPATYRFLLEAGIREDHSMGYSDAVGWRAGTNLPFFWYDLSRETATPLVVHPFAAMDVTLRNYLGMDAAQAGTTIRSLAAAVLPVGGPFPLLWHNSSFAAEYGWEGWWEMYTTTLADLLAGEAVPWSPETD
ncbi:polysaccharide deacetylase family protein [Lewinella sp. IMCC34183]|uniref:polysaccharide deacetylase family protein n=1 Tax=Lewinella sp. IMCC34183 TaxID=2248762 RepID=UPI0013003C72|nr:polysaccharide deacetylase family protein [Lewinella sp. IMCC34183]